MKKAIMKTFMARPKGVIARTACGYRAIHTIFFSTLKHRLPYNCFAIRVMTASPFSIVMSICLLFLSPVANANEFMQNADSTGQLLFSRDNVTIVATGSIPMVMPETPATKDDKAPEKPLNVGDKDPKTGQTVIFKKDTPSAPEPQTEDKTSKIVYSTEPREIQLSTEVRDESAFELEWLPSLHNLTDSSAYMVVMRPTNMIHISNLRTPIKLDIVIIRPNGRVLAIMPDIAPSSLGSDIDAGEDVRGVMFLKSGLAKQLGIRPNDEVKHHGFMLDPKVLK